MKRLLNLLNSLGAISPNFTVESQPDLVPGLTVYNPSSFPVTEINQLLKEHKLANPDSKDRICVAHQQATTNPKTNQPTPPRIGIYLASSISDDKALDFLQS